MADHRISEHVSDQIRLEFVHEYDLTEPSPDIDDLLEEIDSDPTSIFWG